MNRRDRIKAVADKIRESIEESTEENGFRVVVTGKGGAGKTTTVAMLSYLFAKAGFNVLAVDEDPQMNLPYALGVPPEEGDRIVPLSKNFDYIEEKVGARPGEGWGLMLTLNPDVSDVVNRFGLRTPIGVNLLVMGTVVQAATGCLCPENALLDAVVRYINLRDGEVILMDTQAGVEHFGRALAKGFKQAVLVTDPTFNSIKVVEHSAHLAREIGIPYVHLLINRVRSNKDVKKVERTLGDTLNLFSEVFELPYEEKLLEYEPNIIPMFSQERTLPLVREVCRLQEVLQRYGEAEKS
ncbi:MAG: AAA family ATPase [Synergistetes bacterium]|nr:AAA family ATPase [Synergistota bacterium]